MSGLEETLAAHQCTNWDDERREWLDHTACTCGVWLSTSDIDFGPAHRAHLAEVIAAAHVEPLEEAFDEAIDMLNDHQWTPECAEDSCPLCVAASAVALVFADATRGDQQ